MGRKNVNQPFFIFRSTTAAPSPALCQQWEFNPDVDDDDDDEDSDDNDGWKCKLCEITVTVKE